MDEDKKTRLKRLIEETSLGFVAIAKELGMGSDTLKIRMAEGKLRVKRVLVDESEAVR